ncbi:MAG: hypothetical protein R3F56_16450 [Planctomycetota bacterium]
MTRSIVAAELEDRTLRVLAAERSGRRLRVVRSGTFQLPSESALDGAVRSVLGARRGRDCELVLALRHRRVTSGQVDRPGGRAQDAAVEIGGQARRLGVYAEDEDLLVGYRLQEHGSPLADVCVAPRAMIDAIAASARGLGFARIRIVASDAVLAHGLTAGGNAPTALLDVQGERAMLALACAGRVLVARHFKLAVPYVARPDNGHEIAPLVFGELMRSISFFGEQGRGEAQGVIVSGPFDEDSALVEALQALLPLPVAAATVPAAAGFEPRGVERGLLVPRLALDCTAADLPHLLEPDRLSRRRLVAWTALQAAGLAAVVTGATILRDAAAPQAQAAVATSARLQAECAGLRAEIDALRAALRPPAAVQARRTILDRLDRRSAARSALCAAVARGRPASLALTKLELAEDGALTLEGVARTDDRLAALRALADFESHLRRVPGLGSGRSSLGEGGAGGQHIAFSLTARLAEVGP